MSREELPLLIFLKESSTHIGNMGLHDIDWNVPALKSATGCIRRTTAKAT
jgi:hypothetical protein